MGDFEIDAAAVTHDHAVVRQTVSPITRRSLGPSLSVFGAKVRNIRRYHHIGAEGAPPTDGDMTMVTKTTIAMAAAALMRDAVGHTSAPMIPHDVQTIFFGEAIFLASLFK